ncbi:MAG TPA: hypothetical protein VJP77_02795 [Planctomycetota bacterium]|nr:hypothetical protein [Planctomycetota bacterium]
MPQQVTCSNANILGASPLTSARAVFSLPASGGDPELVFAGMGSGIAVLSPALFGVRDPAPDAEPIECYECRPGPGDKLVVTSLDRGLWVIDDASSPSGGSDSYLRTRSQAIGLANDPGDPTRLFVADGGSGVPHVQL